MNIYIVFVDGKEKAKVRFESCLNIDDSFGLVTNSCHDYFLIEEMMNNNIYCSNVRLLLLRELIDNHKSIYRYSFYENLTNEPFDYE